MEITFALFLYIINICLGPTKPNPNVVDMEPYSTSVFIVH